MYWDKEKGKTRIRKGFFTFEDFWQAANEIPEDVHRVFIFVLRQVVLLHLQLVTHLQ